MSRQQENSNFVYLDRVKKRLPFELATEALAIYTTNPAIIIGVSALILFDIGQAFFRTFRDLKS